MNRIVFAEDQVTAMTCTMLPKLLVDEGSQPLLSTMALCTASDFAAIRSDWNRLFEASGCRNVFLTFEWMYQWWIHFGSGHQLLIVAVRHGDGEIVGLAPFYISRKAGWLRRLGLLGDQFVGSDYLDLLVNPACRSAAVSCVADYLLANPQRWDYLDFADTLPDSMVATTLREHLEEGGLTSGIVRASICPYIPLTRSKDSYLDSLSPKMRKHLRYYLRSLERLGVVEFVTAEGMELEQAFDELFRLHQARFRERDASSAFAERRVGLFHRAILKSFVQSGTARVHLLRLNGRSIAAVYVLSVASKTFFYQSGMDPEYAHFSAGSVILQHAIEYAERRGCVEFDFLRGDEIYKFRWTSHKRQLQSVRMFDGRLRSRIAHAGERLRGSLRSYKARFLSGLRPATLETPSS